MKLQSESRRGLDDSGEAAGSPARSMVDGASRCLVNKGRARNQRGLLAVSSQKLAR